VSKSTWPPVGRSRAWRSFWHCSRSPGSTIAWDAFSGGGFVPGFPAAIAAGVLGIQALRVSRNGRGTAMAAIVIGGAMAALTIVWMLVSAM
jgi:hypothetical protein